ncbi:MAG: ribonuclease R [Pseudomonadota bacterium]|nr:ribonuclease R [Pseudomonadota bacterium]
MVDKKSSDKGKRRSSSAEREEIVYKKSITSREDIYHILRGSKKYITIKALTNKLKIGDDLEYALQCRVKAMLRDGQLLEDRHKHLGAVKGSKLVKAKVSMTKNRTVLLDAIDSLDPIYSLFLAPKQTQQLMSGDIITVRAFKAKKFKKTPVIIVKINQRAHSNIVGKVREYKGLKKIETLNGLCAADIVVADDEYKAKQEEFVVAKIVQYPTERTPLYVEVEDILGDMEDPRLITKVMISMYNLDGEFSSEAIEEANAIDEKGVFIEQGRKDYRKKNFFTIDGADARDFDDAICVEKEGAGWNVFVAISDVSHYIKTGSALDKEAYQRATSVYLPNSVLPMLPSILSDGLCSLNPNVDRLVKCLKINLSEKGEVLSYRFSKAVICSRMRLTYTEAYAIINDQVQVENWLTMGLLESLKVYKILEKKRYKRGALEIDLPYASLIFNKNNKIESIVKERRLVTHKIIEELMLLANEITAGHLLKTRQPAVYRNHASPDIEKINKVRSFLRVNALIGEVQNAKQITPKKIQQAIYHLMKKEHGEIYIPIILSTLAQACYEDNNKGHFGLAYKHYTHFTSPIRRYPDLIIHRSLDRIIQESQDTNSDILQKGLSMKEAALHASIKERNADEAQKKAIMWLKSYFMQDKVGKCYDGTIAAIKSFGMFICIDCFCIDGMCHISTLGAYYDYNDENMTLTSDGGDISYHMGQKVKVRVSKVDVLQQSIDLEILG